MNDGIRLLLVDDRPEDRMALRKQLMLGGLNTSFIGETGLGGEAIMAAVKLTPDVVLISVEEPLGRPLRMLEALTMSGGAPIIVLSSIGDRDCLRKAMRAGAREYLVKPINSEELTRAIEDILGAERQRRSVINSGAVEARSRGEVVTIFGNKGGIGKTTLATNLAVALALARRRVALLDLNFEQPDVPIMLDIAPDYTLVDVVQVIDRLESDGDLLQRFLIQHNSGVEVVAAPSDLSVSEELNTQYIGRTIELLARKFDYVVIDTAPRLHGAVLTALEAATLVLVVTTPDVPCLKNTKAALETLRGQYTSQDKVKLVVNEAYMPDGVSYKDVGKVLDYPIFWNMPYDRQVVECIKLGRPCIQAKGGGKVSRSISDLANTLSGAARPQKGLLERISHVPML